MKISKLIRLSLLFLLVALCFFLSFNANKNPERLFWSDMEGYYVYLPATFIYDGFANVVVRDTAYLRPYNNSPKIYTKYTCGVAILEAPFFLIAHVLSSPLGFPSNGHSTLYSYAIMISGIFYMMLGFWCLYLLLRYYFNKWISLLVPLCLLLGTNLYYYTFFQPAMSHVYSFFLFAALLLITENITQTQANNSKSKLFSMILLLGITSGLIVLIRPTGIIVLLYPLYRWWKSCENKSSFVFNNKMGILLGILLAMAVWVPQLYYWKSISGDWFIWSYKDEGFKFWKEPKLFRVLFDAWNGWILYNPIVIVPIFGLFMGRHTNFFSERITAFILFLATYIFGSWWAWWFGGAYGHRCFVDFLPLLSLPFAHVLMISAKNKKILLGIGLVCALFIYYNVRLIYNYSPPWDGEHWTYQSWWNEVLKIF